MSTEKTISKQSAFVPEKGKPVERQGRKVTGLRENILGQRARQAPGFPHLRWIVGFPFPDKQVLENETIIHTLRWRLLHGSSFNNNSRIST